MRITNEQSKEIYELSKSTTQVCTNTEIAKKYGISEGAVRKHIKKWESTVHEIANTNDKVHAAVAKNTLDVIGEALMIVSNIKAEIRDARSYGGDPSRMGSLYAQWIKALELAAKLLGDLKGGPEIQVNNIHVNQVNQQFNEFMQVVLTECDVPTKVRISQRIKGNF